MSAEMDMAPPAKRGRVKVAGPVSREVRISALTDKLSFWFSPANLRRDRFIQERMVASPGSWLTVHEILTFTSVKQLAATREDVLSAAVAVSGVQVDIGSGGRLRLEGGPSALEHLLSTGPLEDEDDRTAYIAHLSRTVTRDSLANALGDHMKNIEYVSIPRSPVGDAKGFAFLEFKDIASATQCIEEIHSLQNSKMATAFPSARAMTRRKWKEEKAARKEERKWNVDYNKTKGREKESERRGREVLVPQFRPGVVVKGRGLDENMSHQATRELFENHGPVAFIECKGTECIVRYMHVSAAIRAVEYFKREGKMTVSTIAGQEESEYWENLLERSRKKRSRKETRVRRAEGAQNRVDCCAGSSTASSLSIAPSGIHLRFEGSDEDVTP